MVLSLSKITAADANDDADDDGDDNHDDEDDDFIRNR